MKKGIRLISLLLCIVFILSSCATGYEGVINSDTLSDSTFGDINNGSDDGTTDNTNHLPDTNDDNTVELKSYSITYNLNGGINSDQNPQKYLENSTFSLEAPSKRAHEFLGWAESADGEVVYKAGADYSFFGDLTLYAKWRYAPTNEEHLELTRRDDIPSEIALSVQDKIAFDYRALGFEVYTTVVCGCYAVCYYYPDMATEDNIIPCGIVLINYPLHATVPTEIEVPCGDYTLVSAFESDDLGQYQYREDGIFYLYDVYGPYVYIEYYNSAQEVDDAIASENSIWDLDLYSWDYDSSDFLTIPFDLIPDYDPTYEWKLFGDYTVNKLIEEIQSLEIIKTATSIETFTGVFLSEELARYVEECLLNGTDILINGVPFEEVVKLATEEQKAGRIIVIEMDGSIGVVDWVDEWTTADDLIAIEEQIAQLQRQLLLMEATVMVGVVLAPFTAGASVPAAMFIGFTFGATTELLQQVYVEERDWDELDWGAITLQGGLGAITAGVSTGVCTWMQNVAKHSITMAHALPIIATGIDLTLDVGATVVYDLAMGYDAEQIKNDVAMTVITNAVISMVTSSCFEKGTEISTPDGAKNIEDVQIGDTVYSYSNGHLTYGKVSQLYKRQAVIWTVYLTNGQAIKTTATHPFYVEGNYIQAKDLQENDALLQLDGTKVYIDCVKQETYYTDVYNFEVEGYNNYFADGVLVHNNCGPKVQELIATDYQNVKHKNNYHPANAEKSTNVYLIYVKEEGLNEFVSGKIVQEYPNLNGKTYREACIYEDGKYILKVGTTVNSTDQRYSSTPKFLQEYGLDKQHYIDFKIIAVAPNKDALMIESQILKNLSMKHQKPVPGNYNYTEYRRSTMYNYTIDINSPDIKWKIANYKEVYLGYGD